MSDWQKMVWPQNRVREITMPPEINQGVLEARLSQLESRLEVAESFNQINLTNNAVLAAAFFQLLEGKRIDFGRLEESVTAYFEDPNAKQRKLINSAIESLTEIAGLSASDETL